MCVCKGGVRCRGLFKVQGCGGGYLQVRCASALDHVDVRAHELAHRGVEDVQVGVLRVGQALGQLLHQHLHARSLLSGPKITFRAQLAMQLCTVQACYSISLPSHKLGARH